jgi:membrane fusion protein, multidrug efflux system
VHVGQPVRVSTRAHPELTFHGKLTRINPSVDPTSRTFQVETVVPNERGLLRPGGFARASIVTRADAKAAVVPMESVVYFAGVTKIFVVENGKAHSYSGVKTGKEGRGWVEIEIAGDRLPETALVVTTGQSSLADGTPVVVRHPEPPKVPVPSGADPASQTAATETSAVSN